MTPRRRRAAVLGHPIGHSLSPVLHQAGYAHLGLPWSYEALDVTEDDLAGFLDECGEDWVGLSLTMPLKKRVLTLVAEADGVARTTGSANTVVWRGNGAERTVRCANTDVDGIVAALQERVGGEPVVLDTAHALVLGAGATAASALAALARLGARRATVLARSMSRASAVREAGDRLGLDVVVAGLERWPEHAASAGVVVSTLPAGAADPLASQVPPATGGTLLDVAYAERPTRLGRSWREAGGRYVSGERMLLHQAVVQVQHFVAGAQADAVGLGAPDVPGLTAAMDRALQDALAR